VIDERRLGALGARPSRTIQLNDAMRERASLAAKASILYLGGATAVTIATGTTGGVPSTTVPVRTPVDVMRVVGAVVSLGEQSGTSSATEKE
jgi:hypothetical protein